uniref:Mini-chromosome maintenance complex-binding protein n=1 Tax=Trichuris muris TaxID=70415 RepID=A0A5S6R5E5_TRIMR
MCICKVYDDWKGIRLNDVIELVGIYYGDGDVSEGHTEPGVVRSRYLHVIAYRKLVVDHPSYCHYDFVTEELLKSLIDIPSARQAVLSLFTDVLYGDELAAEYLLCHLLSSVRHRVGTLPVGSMPLNLFKAEEALAGDLGSLFKQLFTKVLYLPLQLDILNNETLVPRKDYETDALSMGKLQLPSGSILLIDENKLQEGALNENGVKNIVALRSIIQWQNVSYDFKWQAVTVETNVNMLAISAGKSMLPFSFALPLEKRVNGKNFHSTVDNGILSLARSYLSLCKVLPLKCSPEQTQQAVGRTFVHARREDPSITQEDLHQWITVAGTLALSCGMDNIGETCWEKAVALERLRRNRINAS